jgi:hypothetical protein
MIILARYKSFRMTRKIQSRKPFIQLLEMMAALLGCDSLKFHENYISLYINTINIFKQRPKLSLYSFVLQLFLLFSLLNPVSVRADNFKIKKISPEGGFTFDAITTICEDKYGFVWFGANSGEIQQFS